MQSKPLFDPGALAVQIISSGLAAYGFSWWKSLIQSEPHHGWLWAIVPLTMSAVFATFFYGEWVSPRFSNVSTWSDKDQEAIPAYILFLSAVAAFLAWVPSDYVAPSWIVLIYFALFTVFALLQMLATCVGAYDIHMTEKREAAERVEAQRQSQLLAEQQRIEWERARQLEEDRRKAEQEATLAAQRVKQLDLAHDEILKIYRQAQPALTDPTMRLRDINEAFAAMRTKVSSDQWPDTETEIDLLRSTLLAEHFDFKVRQKYDSWRPSIEAVLSETDLEAISTSFVRRESETRLRFLERKYDHVLTHIDDIVALHKDRWQREREEERIRKEQEEELLRKEQIEKEAQARKEREAEAVRRYEERLLREEEPKGILQLPSVQGESYATGS